MSKKIILVSFPAGRVGSSVAMSYLQYGGLYVGEFHRLKPPSPMNPKGFLELYSHDKFLSDKFGEIYENYTFPPSIKKIKNLVNKNLEDFKKIIRKEFGNHEICALKCPRMLSSFFLDKINHLEVKVIYLGRNKSDHIKSIQNSWARIDDKSKYYASEKYIKTYLDVWDKFCLETINDLNYPCLKISFEDILEDFYPTAQKIDEFTGVHNDNMDTYYSEFIDRTLYKRDKIRNKDLGISRRIKSKFLKIYQKILINY